MMRRYMLMNERERNRSGGEVKTRVGQTEMGILWKRLRVEQVQLTALPKMGLLCASDFQASNVVGEFIIWLKYSTVRKIIRKKNK